MSEKKNGKRGVLIIIIALLLVFILLLAGLLYYFMVLEPAKHNKKEIKGGQREAAALQGSINVMTEEEIQEALANTIREGMFRISIASEIFAIEGGDAQVRIENNLSNRYIMQVTIYRDDTGEEIYATDLIDPGYYILNAKLDVDVPSGEYDVTAVFTALYPDTEEIVGTAGANVKLYVFPRGTRLSTYTPAPTPTPTPTPMPTVEVTQEEDTATETERLSEEE